MRKDIQDKINTLDRMIGWVENCDTKATVMTALVGVFVSVIFTSSFITDSLHKLVAPISIYWKTGSGYFNLFCAVKLVIFIGMTTCFLFALFALLKSLTAKTSSKQTGDSHVKTHSLIHYGSIQMKSYNDFKSNTLSETEEDILEDVLSQIYINSKRCQEKFDDYNKSIKFIRIGIVLFVLFVTLIIW
jgi:hypothetical protein